MQEMQETRLGSLGQEDPLKEGVATHSSILARRIPWTEEPSRLQSIGLQTDMTELTDCLTHTHTELVSVTIRGILFYYYFFNYFFYCIEVF